MSEQPTGVHAPNGHVHETLNVAASAPASEPAQAALVSHPDVGMTSQADTESAQQQARDVSDQAQNGSAPANGVIGSDAPRADFESSAKALDSQGYEGQLDNAFVPASEAGISAGASRANGGTTVEPRGESEETPKAEAPTGPHGTTFAPAAVSTALETKQEIDTTMTEKPVSKVPEPFAEPQPPFKKVQTEEPTYSGPMEMTPAQLKFAQNTIKSLRSRREAFAFLKPVDPIAQKIPQYSQFITHPMDLGTVDIKLALTAMVLKPTSKPSEKAKQAPQWNLDPAKDYYRRLNEFERDVRLVFTNCATFNGPDSPYTQNAKTMESAFDKYMKDVPPAGGVHHGSGSGAESRARRSSNPVPTIRRSSSNAGGRPKREIHPPPSKDLPWANEPQSASASGARKVSRKVAKKGAALTAREEAYHAKVTQDELKFCTRVVDDLLKPSYQALAWVFYDIPTMDYDWAPAYFNIIKKPVSLKMVQKNLKAGHYADAEDFDADMKLIFRNCATFNPPGSDVYSMGEQLKATYEDKMSRKPVPAPMQPDYDDSDEDEEDDEDAESLAKLQTQIAGLEATLASLEGAKSQNHDVIANTKALLASVQQGYATSGSTKKGSKSKGPRNAAGSKRKAASEAGGSGSGRKKSKAKVPSAGGVVSGPATDYMPSKKAATTQKKPSPSKKAPATSKRGEGDDDIRAVTYEQKEELAAKITELSEDRLEGAIRIINEDKPPNQSEEEEIELDIDELSPRTLYKLYKFVVRPNKKSAAAVAAAASKNNGRSAPLDGRKRGTGGLKKKNLDEGEEAERIARLQQQLEQFGNPDAAASAATGMHDDLVHSDSSSDGESGSDSDSD